MTGTGPGATVPPGLGPSRGRAAVVDVLAVLGGYLVLGLVCGVVWWLLVDPPVYVKRAAGGSMGELQLDKRFDADGWYAVIAGVAGLLSGLLMSWWRSRDNLLTTVLLVPGAALAAALMAFTGRLLGPVAADQALALAERGDRVPLPLEVTAAAGYLVWPIAALIGALLVLWSTPTEGPADHESSRNAV